MRPLPKQTPPITQLEQGQAAYFPTEPLGFEGWFGLEFCGLLLLTLAAVLLT
jgi:hypothetical protein